MEIGERLSSFKRLGERLRAFVPGGPGASDRVLDDAIRKSSAANPWFTPEQVTHALHAIGGMLAQESLERWIDPYLALMPAKPCRVGCVMAGNIPAVGFHDMLCVLMAGHLFTGKLSSDDAFLLPAIALLLEQDEPGWSGRIRFAEGRLQQFDAIIATGSDNSARYFEYYFGKYPSLIRHNRNSVALLTGNETAQDLKGIADDMLLYFGLGCRSVSHLLVPAGYELGALSEACSGYSAYAHHNKYRNNYDYLKAIYMMNRVPVYDNGFMLMRQHEAISSPVSEIRYTVYNDREEVNRWLEARKEQLQCVVSTVSAALPPVAPGAAQSPAITDYADGIDTMKFLLSGISEEKSLQIK